MCKTLKSITAQMSNLIESISLLHDHDSVLLYLTSHGEKYKKIMQDMVDSYFFEENLAKSVDCLFDSAGIFAVDC